MGTNANGSCQVNEHERFWAKVNKTDTCWLWTACVAYPGYGRFGVGGARRNGGYIALAHRWSYEESFGPIPEGLVLDHLCGVKNCVNPAHLEVVTPAENAWRAHSPESPWYRGAPLPPVASRKDACRNGHPWTTETEMTVNAGNGIVARRCRICFHEYLRRKKSDWRELNNNDRGRGTYELTVMAPKRGEST